MPPLLRFIAVVICSALIAACNDDAAHARVVIREQHAKEVQTILAGDVARHLTGVQAAAHRLARGFLVEDPAKRSDQMRVGLHLIGKPPRGVQELIGSARTFLAAVDKNGVVFAIDADKDKDKMSGLNLGAKFAVLRAALGGQAGYAVDQFPGLEKGAAGNWSLLFAAPVRHDGEIVGAVLTGIPLWKLSQRLSKQLQLDHVSEQGAIVWVYVYKGAELHHFGTPPDLDTIVPNAKARKAGLVASAKGFTGEVMQFGRWYGYGVLPTPRLGADMGVVIFRSDPM